MLGAATLGANRSHPHELGLLDAYGIDLGTYMVGPSRGPILLGCSTRLWETTERASIATGAAITNEARVAIAAKMNPAKCIFEGVCKV